MLYWKKGDMFDTPASLRVNTVNCVGVMGKGVALAFKQRYPGLFNAYRAACRKGEVYVGSLWVYTVAPDLVVVNFPTKEDWRNPSKLEWVESGLVAFRSYLFENPGHTVTLPPLGCGNGGLDWDRVWPLVERYLQDAPATINAFIPG